MEIAIPDDKLQEYLVSTALIVGLASVGLLVVHLLARRTLAWVHGLDSVGEDRRQQVVTLVMVVRWVLDIVLVVTAVLMLLSTYGVNIGPLLAGVGVAGLAISLGAQTLIKDLIGGMLIILENQFAVGDTILVGDVSGVVERITLRTTQVRAGNGDLYTVPNGELRVVANQTTGWSRVVIDLGVAYEEDLDRVQRVLEESAAAFAQDPTHEPYLLEQPQVQGVVNLGDWAVVIRVTAKCTSGEQWLAGRLLRRHLLTTCEQEGISLPYPRQEVVVRGDGDA